MLHPTCGELIRHYAPPSTNTDNADAILQRAHDEDRPWKSRHIAWVTVSALAWDTRCASLVADVGWSALVDEYVERFVACQYDDELASYWRLLDLWYREMQQLRGCVPMDVLSAQQRFGSHTDVTQIAAFEIVATALFRTPRSATTSALFATRERTHACLKQSIV